MTPLSLPLFPSQTTIESAKQLFERVIEVRFDNGRPLPLLIGAALYLQCRLDRLEYLVSDVAKALQVCVPPLFPHTERWDEGSWVRLLWVCVCVSVVVCITLS